MIVAFSAGFELTQEMRQMIACIDAGQRAWGVTDQEMADRLGVSPSRLTAMRAGLDAGPGFLRFAKLPAAFWIGFLKEWGVQFAIRVITDAEIEKQIAWLNFWMVKTMKRDMVSAYPDAEMLAAAESSEEGKRTA